MAQKNVMKNLFGIFIKSFEKLVIACENIMDVKLSVSLEFIDLVILPRNFNDS